MTSGKGTFRQFPQSFWAANTMEIFERMGWYGFYAASALYLTGPVEDGGLGFSSADRGVIQGLATFFLYLFPAVFGALADRYGYKKMFLASAAVMAPAYLLLSLPTGFWPFLGPTPAGGCPDPARPPAPAAQAPRGPAPRAVAAP